MVLQMLRQSFQRPGWHQLPAFALLALLTSAVQAQGPGAAAAAERQAMQKLAFLAGRWAGPVTITHGPGAVLHLTQSEEVRYKLDGLVILVEGSSTGPDGTTQFQALATIAYDDSSHTYRFRAYNNGRYVDSELTVLADGFSWGFDAGPAHVLNAMHLTSRGEWQESSEVRFGDQPPQRSVEMLLHREP